MLFSSTIEKNNNKKEVLISSSHDGKIHYWDLSSFLTSSNKNPSHNHVKKRKIGELLGTNNNDEEDQGEMDRIKVDVDCELISSPLYSFLTNQTSISSFCELPNDSSSSSNQVILGIGSKNYS